MQEARFEWREFLCALKSRLSVRSWVRFVESINVDFTGEGEAGENDVVLLTLDPRVVVGLRGFGHVVASCVFGRTLYLLFVANVASR